MAKKLSTRQRYLKDAATCQRYAAISYREAHYFASVEMTSEAIYYQEQGAHASEQARYYLFTALDIQKRMAARKG